ncbi:HIT family protein [Natronomonas amylolytica]|uniref:HIT family protein n=1 Tax=Natronomonas amylolytica TaxID=3108498 RepID=UPI0030094866
MSDCQFCDIAAGEAPATRLYEDETTVAFLDIAPVVRGHTLVVPKGHYETLTDIPPETVGDLFERVRIVAGAVEAAFDPDGLNILQANGEAAGQEVFHAHVHILPRYEDDDVQVRWPAGELTESEASEIATAIRAELPE